MQIRIFFFVVLSLLVFRLTQAVAVVDTVSSSLRYKVLPSVYYLPETRLAFGAIAFSLIKSADSAQRVGNLQHYLSFTQNRQILLENSWQVFGRQNSWILQGKADASRFPELFFGIGKAHLDCEPVRYSSFMVNVQNQFLKHLGHAMYVGVSTSFHSVSQPQSSPLSTFDKLKMATGGMGYWATLAGPAFIFDTRDFTLNASSGTYFELSFHQGLSLATPPFQLVAADFRKFFPVAPLKAVVALQGIHRAAFGPVPFRLMPSLGGPSAMRGYFAGQLRDNKIWMLQAEWRQHIAGRFGAVLFTGFGNFAPHYQDIFYRIHHQAGVGLRYRLQKNDRVNLRIDYAHTGKFSNLYVVVAEAF